MSGGPTPLPLAEATVAIVGMGLLGGSLALALHGTCGRVLGIVAPGDELAAVNVLDRGLVDDITTLERAAALADIVILATPVGTIIELVGELAPRVRPGMIVTDVGSTKLAIVKAMQAAAAAGADEVNWVGGHPMAGGTESGLGAIDAQLFTGASWALCPVEGAVPARLVELVETLGATPIELDPTAHDSAVAITSHLPFLLAVSLVDLASDAGTDLRLAGRGWGRATIGATGDVDMWLDILRTNRAELATAAEELARRLRAFAGYGRAEDEPDPAGLRTLLEQAQLATREPRQVAGATTSTVTGAK